MNKKLWSLRRLDAVDLKIKLSSYSVAGLAIINFYVAFEGLKFLAEVNPQSFAAGSVLGLIIGPFLSMLAPHRLFFLVSPILYRVTRRQRTFNRLEKELMRFSESEIKNAESKVKEDNQLKEVNILYPFYVVSSLLFFLLFIPWIILNISPWSYNLNNFLSGIFALFVCMISAAYTENQIYTKYLIAIHERIPPP